MTGKTNMGDLARRNIRLAADCHQRAVWAEAIGDWDAAEVWTTSAIEHQHAASVLGYRRRETARAEASAQCRQIAIDALTILALAVAVATVGFAIGSLFR